jgi:hypothetical protein
LKFEIAGGLLAAFFAQVQLRLVLMLFGGAYGASVAASLGVMQGRPHWRVYQSRVLGPALVDLLDWIVRDDNIAYELFSAVALAAAGYLAWRLGRQIGGTKAAALLAFCLFQMGFAFLLTPPWLYAWDFIDVIVFLAFVGFVWTGKNWRWFAALFAVAIFNRESAEFIALWMMLTPLTRALLARRGLAKKKPFDRAMPIAGFACFIAGFGIVEGLRRALLIEEVGPKLFPNSAAANGPDFHFKLFDNLRDIGAASGNLQNLAVIYFLILLAGLIFRLAWRDPARWLGLALVHFALLVSILVFGAMFETRLYLEFIPIVIAACLVFTANPARRKNGPGFSG